MKKTFIAIAICLTIAVTASLAIGQKVNAPWWNEQSGWSTYIVITGDNDTTSDTLTVLIYSSTGAELVATTASISGDGDPWVRSVAGFISNEDTTAAFGSLAFETDNTINDVGLSDVSIVISVQNDSSNAGFIIPIYPDQPNTNGAGKYAVGAAAANN